MYSLKLKKKHINYIAFREKLNCPWLIALAIIYTPLKSSTIQKVINSL